MKDTKEPWWENEEKFNAVVARWIRKENNQIKNDNNSAQKVHGREPGTARQEQFLA